jgi:hypothetical protein
MALLRGDGSQAKKSSKSIGQAKTFPFSVKRQTDRFVEFLPRKAGGIYLPTRGKL